MPRITAAKMAGNYSVDEAWCPGCGLYAHVNNGTHRGDCTRGLHHRVGDDPPSTTVIHNGDNTPTSSAQHPDQPQQIGRTRQLRSAQRRNNP